MFQFVIITWCPSWLFSWFVNKKLQFVQFFFTNMSQFIQFQKRYVTTRHFIQFIVAVCSICSGTRYVSDFSWNYIPVCSLTGLIWLSLTQTQSTDSLSEGEIIKGFDERKISQCMIVNKKDLFKNLGSVHRWNPTNADVWKGKGVSSTNSGQMTHGFIKACYDLFYCPLH